MLIGVDPLHVVVVEQSKDRWTRHTENGAKAAFAHPSIAQFLTERLNATGN
jgi:hypothetical protein